MADIDTPYRSPETVSPSAGKTVTAQWRIVGLLMALCFLCHFNRTSISVAGNARIMSQFGIDPVEMGTVYSAYLFAYTLCMIPGGWLIDRRGPKFALGAMVALSAVLVALTGAVGLAGSSAMALAGFWSIRTTLGVVSAPMHPGAARMVSQWFHPGGRALANGIVTAAALLGIASTYYGFGQLIEWFDWPIAFCICGGITAIAAVVWLVVATDGPRMVRRSMEDEPWLALLANRNLWLLTVSYAAIGYFQYLFFYWSEYYFKTELHVSVDESRLFATLPSLAMAVGMFSGGGLSDSLMRTVGYRAGRIYLPMFGMVASAALLWLGTLTKNPAFVATWFALAMGVLGLAEGPFWVAAIEAGGKRGGSSAAIFNTGGNAGGILAPIITPLFGEHFGWKAGFGVACVFCVLGAALWNWVDLRADDDSVA